MAQKTSRPRTGNAVVFFTAILFVAVFVVGGVFYLIPGFVHPFTSDTAAAHYAHATFAGGFFLAAIVGLVIVRGSRPPPSDETTIP
jgi:hypothetical protein